MRDRSHATAPPGFHRRGLIRGLLASPFATGALSSGRAEEPEPPRARGLIVRQKDPDNLEFPFSTLDTRRLLTPNELFYVRTHFEEPRLDAGSWRLKVEGAVERPLELDIEALRALPSKTRTVLLECSGNGRALLKPPQIGIRWELGAVGTAEWTGPTLAAVLEKAGVRPGAVEVILEGRTGASTASRTRGPPA
ncbi:MAG: molybdopterin-dependent oxidoreductase [Isosphaeraceae bacterium]